MEELLKSLIYIQQNLNAPKDQYNNFGKYKYRSLEGTLAALKPLLSAEGCGIRFEDEVVDHCGRTFLRTTLYFFNDKGQMVTNSAEAEHAANKSGMDASQITGAASSYARKYALNGMFCIDDTQDADTDQYHNQNNNAGSQKRAATPRRGTPASQQQPQQPALQQTDRYSGIRTAISLAMSTEELLDLYNSHKIVVDSDPNIRALFTQRKNELMSNLQAA